MPAHRHRRKHRRRKQRGGDIYDALWSKTRAEHPDWSNDQVGAFVDGDKNPGFFNVIGNAMTNPKHYERAATLAKPLVGVFEGKMPDPGEVYKAGREVFDDLMGYPDVQKNLTGEAGGIMGKLQRDMASMRGGRRRRRMIYARPQYLPISVGGYIAPAGPFLATSL